MDFRLQKYTFSEKRQSKWNDSEFLGCIYGFYNQKTVEILSNCFFIFLAFFVCSANSNTVHNGS